MNIKFEITGVQQVKVYINNVASSVTHIAINAVAKVFKRELKVDQPYKYASRKEAYGSVSTDGAPDGYFSWKQFRYVAWLTHGFTDRGSKRTGKSSAAWEFTDVNAGAKTGYIKNPSPGAYFTRSDYGQARQPANVGWKKASNIISENLTEAEQEAVKAVNNFLKSK